MKKNYFLMNGIMSITMVLFLMTNPVQAQLYINEFMASNDVSFPGPQGDYPDWIEIYNAGDNAVMLGGYYMSDVLDDPEAMFQIPSTYPDSVTVDAGGYILFYANKGEASSVLNLNFKLSGDGESIGLWNSSEELLDSYTYEAQTTDVSFGRYPDGTDTWAFMPNITPGAMNESPEPAEVILYINEFMASNDFAFPGPQGDYPDWIEIYNAGMESVMLGGYYLSDKLDDPAAMFMIPSTYPDSVTVAPGEFIVFYANNDSAWSVLNTNFKLSGDGEHVGLWDPDQMFLDSITYGPQIADTSYGRYQDGTDNWYMMADFTPGASNTNPNIGPAEVELYINEFMASNDFSVPGPQGDHPDWIEIYNAGTEPVMLGGYYLSDKLDVPEDMYQIPSTYPDSVTVAPGGFIVFYANDDTAWSVLNTNFKLSGGGEHVGLWNPDQMFLDSITYGPQIADTSYGRYEDGTDNWYMMVDYTPGASNTNPNEVPTDVMLYINEFMASNDFSVPGPQGDHPDWIEIYNAGDEAVMLGGYYLSDKLDVPEDMYQIPSTYPDSVTVAPGGFIVFYANDDTAWSVLNTNFKLSGGGEHVGLWSPEEVFLDSITYGPQEADTSYGRYTDGTNNWYKMIDFTPGESNVYVDAIIENESNISTSQNFPNPFEGETSIEFELNSADHVVITIYSITGSVVTELANDQFGNGKHIVKWDASELPAGYYFYSIKTSSSTIVNKASKIR